MAGESLTQRFLSLFFVGVIVAIAATLIGTQLWMGSNTMPKVNENMADLLQRNTPPQPVKEGFGAPAKGSGTPDCSRVSQEASDLRALLSSKTVGTEEGPDDLRELTQILSKLSCFKKDLMGAAGVVEATRPEYQPFSTSHDLEPVGETTARCFAKTLPKRDLELSLDKWSTRGFFLIKRICTAAAFDDADLKKAEELFHAFMKDIGSVALDVCAPGEVKIAGQMGPRDAVAFSPPQLEELHEQKGYQ